MGTDQPTGDQIIDALERLGFEILEEDSYRAVLNKVDKKVAIPKGEIADPEQESLAKQLKFIFAEYETVPLAKSIEYIKDWAEEMSH